MFIYSLELTPVSLIETMSVIEALYKYLNELQDYLANGDAYI